MGLKVRVRAELGAEGCGGLGEGRGFMDSWELREHGAERGS